MNIYDTIFILQFLALIIVLIIQLYNIMSFGNYYDQKTMWLMFIIAVCAYSFGFMIYLFQNTNMLYMQIFNFETWLIRGNIMILAIEILMYYKDIYKPKQAYMANKQN